MLVRGIISWEISSHHQAIAIASTIAALTDPSPAPSPEFAIPTSQGYAVVHKRGGDNREMRVTAVKRWQDGDTCRVRLGALNRFGITGHKRCWQSD